MSSGVGRALGRIVALALLATSALGLPAGGAAGHVAREAAQPQPLYFQVRIGPASDRQTCSVVADLYVPDGVDARHRAPALLMTNGFAGSKEGFAALAPYLAGKGYVVLAYSGLGFGGSGCKISLDHPAYDGLAARTLISYLGGERGRAFLDAGHTVHAPALRVVQRDRRDHTGRRSAHDPRVGMFGGSYGGAIQFAAASVDPRLDTIVPMATWNDLRYALAPNNLVAARPGPGLTKLLWGATFSAVGFGGGVVRAPDDPHRLVGCPNFVEFVCPALAFAGVAGYFQPAAQNALAESSVTSYVRKVRIPTLLVQGQADTLFNLNEAVRTYRALRQQGTPVSMIWQYGGHSAPAAPGEISETSPGPNQYVLNRILRWYDHHLRGSKRSAGPGFSYFQDWIDYRGSARPAYRTMHSYRSGPARTFHLSGGGRLVASRTPVTSEAQYFVTPPAGAPSTINPLDVLGGFTTPQGDQVDTPGTFAAWTSSGLRRPLDLVGSPMLRVQVVAPSAAQTQGTGPAGRLALFLKVVDVAPDGTATTLKALEAPIRIGDVNRPFTVRFPAVVHRFQVGHRIRLVIAGGSGSYRGGLASVPVAVAGGVDQRLTLPTGF